MTPNKYAARLTVLAAGAALVAHRAAAQVVVVPVNQSRNGTVNTGFYFNPVGSEFSTTGTSTAAKVELFFTTSAWKVTTTNVSFVGVTGSPSTFSHLTAGTTIGGGSNFVSGTDLFSDSFPKTSGLYLGYSVPHQGAGSNETWYGWIELDASAATALPYNYTVVQYAYNNTGGGIAAGATTAIPEPSVTALIFGLITTGLIGYRRLKRTRTAAAPAALGS